MILGWTYNAATTPHKCAINKIERTMRGEVTGRVEGMADATEEKDAVNPIRVFVWFIVWYCCSILREGMVFMGNRQAESGVRQWHRNELAVFYY